MRNHHHRTFFGLVSALALGAVPLGLSAETIGLWLFDEQEGIYPSSLLNDAGPNDYSLIIGRGGKIVPGKFGRALRAAEPAPFEPMYAGVRSHEEFSNASRFDFGLVSPPQKPGRKVPPMTWFNATFAAGFMNGDQHLRRRPFPHPTAGALNFTGADFTIEFWFRADSNAAGEGVVLEVGTGPRGENDIVNRLTFHPREGEFRFFNQPSGATARLKTDTGALQRDWTHCAFVYDARRGELTHYLNGRPVGTAAGRLQALPKGEEDYFSLARDAVWQRPLAGALDELRISKGTVYRGEFSVPQTFSKRLSASRAPVVLQKGPPLQFPAGKPASAVVELGKHKHLFIDDALIARSQDIAFTAHPARIEETVLKHGTGWSTVVEDEDGLIRLYGESGDGVGVWTSRDGINFETPDFGNGRKNTVAGSPARRGSVFIDPNGPPEERWKLFVGLHERGGFFVYTSPDGWNFKRNEVTALPFWAGSASTIYYDDQRQRYVAHHRTDYGRTASGKTYRYFLRTEVTDITAAWPFSPVTEARKEEMRKFMRLGDRTLDPWWLDNGPLAAGGFSIEYPIAMGPDPQLDPIGTDLYNTRAMKYPWAPDTYVAFPLWFFHYYGDGPLTRQVLEHEDFDLGSGMVETQLAVSRDGVTWKRYPRPAYIPIGTFKGFPMRRPYIAFGMVRRGNEIWQYVYTRSSYHGGGFSSVKLETDSPLPRVPQEGDDGILPAVVQRLSQRLDGFVSVDAPYEKEATFTTHPFRFEGNRLVVNADTGATGYAQIGFEDESGRPVPGFSVDECVYININDVEHEVRWLTGQKLRADVSSLAGRPVRMVVRFRGASLYAFQFLTRN
jgi:hypothetical protein